MCIRDRGGDADERTKHLFLADAIGRARAYHGRLEVVALGELLALGGASAQQDLPPLLPGDLDVADHALAVLRRGQRPHLGLGVERVAEADRARQREEALE